MMYIISNAAKKICCTLWRSAAIRTARMKAIALDMRRGVRMNCTPHSDSDGKKEEW